MPPGEYSLAPLGRDTLAVVYAGGIGRFASWSLLLGGMIGQWLALTPGTAP